MKEPWWPPNAIRYRKNQIYWLLQHIETIRNGGWPPEHRETGYSGGKGKHINYSANYEQPIQIAAELLQRIEKCWSDSYLLLLQVGYSNIEQVIANGEHKEIEIIKRRIKTVLKYISGNERKNCSYREFKNHKKRLPRNSQ